MFWIQTIWLVSESLTWDVTLDVERLRADLERSQQQVQEALASIGALTEQNEHLTILLANEQAQRIKALRRPLGWIRSFF